MKKYGCINPLKCEKIKNKYRETHFNNHGVFYPFQCLKTREKFKETCIKKYGVENPLQSKEIQDKIHKNSKKYKEYITHSGEIRKIQGYEHFALDELFVFCDESEIITDRCDIPRIPYTVNDKQHFYFPDIYIPSINTIIEVKSTWTYTSKIDNINTKREATIKAGYDYEIWIYDSKGNKTVVK